MMSEKTAKLIYIIFHPLINSTIATILLLSADRQLDLKERALFAGVTILFPLLIVAFDWYLVHNNIVESREMVIREQRLFPLVITAFILFAGFVVLWLLNAPKLVQGLMVSYAAITLIFAVISYWWKVSIHTAGIVCPLVALTYSFGLIILPFYLLVPLVGDSRLVLKRHTLNQIIVSALLTLIVTTVQFQFFFS